MRDLCVKNKLLNLNFKVTNQYFQNLYQLQHQLWETLTVHRQNYLM